MAAGDYYLSKSNGTSFDEKVITAISGRVLGFDASLNPVMLDVSLSTHTHSYLPLAGGTMSNTNLVSNLKSEYSKQLYSLNSLQDSQPTDFPLGGLSATTRQYFTGVSNWMSGIVVRDLASFNTWELIGYSSDFSYNEWYFRSGITTFGSLLRIWHSGNFDAINHTHAYLPLTGGAMNNTNLVTSLNADLLDGQHSSAFANASHTHSYLNLAGGTMSNNTVVTNMNADLLDGQHSSAFANASHTHSYLNLAGGTMSNNTVVTNMNADMLDGLHGSSYIDTVSRQLGILGTKVFGSSAMGGLSHNYVLGTKGTSLRGLKALSYNENLFANMDLKSGYTISAPNTSTFTGNINSLFDGNTGSGIQILTDVINDTTPFVLEITGPSSFMSFMYFGSFFIFTEWESYVETFGFSGSKFTSWKVEVKSAQDGLWYTLIDRTGSSDYVNNLTLSGFDGTSSFFTSGGRFGSGFRLTIRAGTAFGTGYPSIYLSAISYFCDGVVTESGNLVSQRGGSIYGNLDIGGSLSIGGNLSVTGNTSISAMTKSGTVVVTNLNADLLDGQHGSYYAAASTAHNPVTIGTANGLSLSTQALSMAAASTSVTGALTSTDWNTFNNKVSFPGFGTTHTTAAYGDHTHSNYDNYNQWTFQPENFAGSGASYTINSAYLVKLKAGTGMDLSHSIVGSTVTVTLTSSGGFPGFGTTHTTAAYGDHTHSNYDNYNQWILMAYNGAYESYAVTAGSTLTFNAGPNIEFDTADLGGDGILVISVVNIPDIVLTGYTYGSTGLIAATDSLKVALSKLQTQMPKTLYSYTSDSSNVSGSATDLNSYTLPANTLSSDGQRLELLYSGSSAGNSNAKIIQFYFGGTSYIVISTSNAAALTWYLRITIIRISSSTFRIHFNGNWYTFGCSTVYGSGLDFSTINVIKLVAQASATSDITSKLVTITHFSS